MKEKNDFTWKEMGEIVHMIKQERVVIFSAVSKLKRIDKKLVEIQDKIDAIIEKTK